MSDYPLSWEEKNLYKFATATARTEYLLEALAAAQGEPDEDATWEQWGGPFASLDEPSAVSRLNFLRSTVAMPNIHKQRARTRLLDYRVLRREVITTEWEEVDDELGRDA